MKSILLIRLKSIGDVVLTLPAVHSLREHFPNAKITFLTSHENASLLRGFCDVDETIALDRRKLQSGNPLKIIPEILSLLRRLRSGRFSLAVDFQGYGETAWFTRFTGAPERWGTVYSSGRQWAYTRSLPRDSNAHAAHEHLKLLRHGGLAVGKIRNEFHLPPDALAEAKTFFAEQKLTLAAPVLFIQPFTSLPYKNWPLENYLTVARHWRSHGVQVILGGGPADRATLESGRQEGFAISAGVPLLITAGLMQLSTLVLGGDTGMLHLAVAQGRRVLMLMHENRPGSPVPFQHPDWLISPPEPLAISSISVAQVNAAIAEIMGAPAGNVSC